MLFLYLSVFLDFFVKENIFYFSLLIVDYSCITTKYCENFRKIEQAEIVQNLPPSYLPYIFLHNLHSFLLWEKVKKID